MDEPIPICTFVIIGLTTICSIRAFRDPEFQRKHLFGVREILAEKQYHRLFTGAFLHADWNHLLMNMVTLFLFGRHIEFRLGIERFLLIYLAAIVGGSLLSLLVHRQHDYHAYGASGGVSGIVFSYIILFPGSGIVMFPLPTSIPAWLYAILYFIGSFIALKRAADNIGHDAHLGGAIIGLWTTAAIKPAIVGQSPKLFVAISLLSVLLFIYLTKNPLFLPLSSFVSSTKLRKGDTDPKPKPAEVDAILDKISKDGIHSLTEAEKRTLRSASKGRRN